MATKKPSNTHTKNDMDNIEQLLEADDVMYIIADRNRSKTDVNLENSTKALNDGDVLADDFNTFNKIGQLKGMPDCKQLFGSIKFNEKESCGCVEAKPKCSDMTLKPDHSIQALPSKKKTISKPNIQDLDCHCSENCLKHSLSRKSTQCFTRMVKKLANSTLSDGKKGKKKSHEKKRSLKSCNICGIKSTKSGTEDKPKKVCDPGLVQKWKKYLDNVMKKLMNELPMVNEPPKGAPMLCKPAKKRKLSLYSRNKLFEAQKRTGKPPMLRCPCGRMREFVDIHKKCAGDSKLVPAHMGWNWNTAQKRKGWIPGAIPNSVKKEMRHFLKPCPCDTLPVTKRASVQRQQPQTLEPNEYDQKPTLRVQRRNNEYTITMNPLKNSQTLKSEPYPYLNCKPLQFKISSSAEEREMQKIAEFICKKGFTKCVCGHKIINCRCRDNREAEALNKCLEDCTRIFGVKNLKEKLCLCDNTKLDIEFTPPAGVIKNVLKRRPDQLVQETQYDELDFRTDFDGKGGLGKKGKNSQGTDDGVEKSDGKVGADGVVGAGGVGGVGIADGTKAGGTEIKTGGKKGKGAKDVNQKDDTKSKEKKKDGKSGSKETNKTKGQNSKEDNKKVVKGKGKSK